MKLDRKLYKVTLGYTDKDTDDATNWASSNVVAFTALEAAKKVKPMKGEYISEIEIVSTVDVA